MEIKRRVLFECLGCRTLHPTKSKAFRCKCNNLCSEDIKGFHSWIYQYSFLDLAFYKCKKCEKELVGKTTPKKNDPLDEIFVKRKNAKEIRGEQK